MPQRPEKRSSLMRMLYVEPLGIAGGMGHYNEALVVAYTQLGHSVEVVTASPSQRLSESATVRTSRFFTRAFDRRKSRLLRSSAYLAAQVGVCLRAIRGRADAVIVHLLHVPVVDLFTLLFLRAAGKRIVMVAHDPVPVLPHQRTFGYSRALRLADLVVVHGQTALTDIVRSGVDADRVLIAPFGDYLAAEPLEEGSAREALGISDELRHPIALIVGNLKPGKGIRRAVQALSMEGSPLGCLVVAGTKQGQWDLDGALRLSSRSELQVVRIDKRMSDREELAAYSLADVVLVLYDSGYSSAVTARAHAVGRPVITTDIGDLRSQAHNSDVVVPRDYSEASLREAIRRCLEHAGDRRQELRLDRWTSHAALVTDRLMQQR